MIKNIIFDFGGVLVQYDFYAFFEKQLGSREKAEWFLTKVFNSDINDEVDLGLLEPREIIERQQRLHPEYHDTLEAFYKNYTDIFTHESEGVRELMEDLKAKGYRLLGLSNWSSLVYRVMDKFHIFDELEDYLLSKDVHQIKPYADIYRTFLKKFRVNAEECVFIDDKPLNIAGAQAMGMYGIVFKNAQQVARALKPLLLPYSFGPIRHEDEHYVWEIIYGASLDMVSKGRRQWDDGYPQRESIIHDIVQGDGYAIRIDDKPVAYCSVTFDGEPAYEQLKGEWISDKPYATLHRMAVSLEHRGKGLARLLIVEAQRLCRKRGIESLRVDTNFDNVEMLHLLENLGFVRCGLCYYHHGDTVVERIAFEKIIVTPRANKPSNSYS